MHTLLRDRRARDDEGVFVCEGPRVLAAALDHGAELVACFVGVDASAAVNEVVVRAAGAGVPVHELAAGVAARIGDTVTPQPVFALARLRRRGPDALDGAGLVLVATEIGDPGNAGTLLRSAAAAGADVIVLGAGSVDAYNPKVVRASAGACFAIPIVEGVPAMQILERLRANGVTRLGAVAHGGEPPEGFDLTQRSAIVLGHEAHGIDAMLPLDGRVTIPMRGAESVNVAMAGTALLFEAARQRRAAS